MQFFSSAIDTLQTLVVALGAGLGVWGVRSARLLVPTTPAPRARA